MEQNKTILSTAELSPELIALISAAGYECRIVPCISISFRNDASIREHAISIASGSEPVIFTSSNAVEGLARLMTGMPTAFQSVFCLSGKTADTVKDLFPNATITATAKDSAALANILNTTSHGPCHFFCGGSRMDTLPKLMQQSGITLGEYIVYDTLLTEPVLNFIPRAVLFFSPSAIESLSVHNDLSAIPLLICIGNSTAAALPKNVQHKVGIAAQHSKESVVQALLQTLKNTSDIC